MTYSMRRFQLLIRPDFLIASEYHLNGVLVFPINEAAGRVDNWDELSIEQFGFRQSDFPTVGD